MESRRHVLLIGLSSSALDSLSSLLQRESFEVHTVDASSFVLDLIRGTPFELLVVGHPIAGFDLADLVEATRGSGSMCQQTAIVVVANEENLDEAATWLDRGVNRIITLEWPRSRIWQAVCDLLNIAPRVHISIPIQIRLPSDVARDIILLQTANISESGALLTGFRSFPHGTRFEFSLSLPDSGSTITGLAEVVRRTNRDREGLEGVLGPRHELLGLIEPDRCTRARNASTPVAGFLKFPNRVMETVSARSHRRGRIELVRTMSCQTPTIRSRCS